MTTFHASRLLLQSRKIPWTRLRALMFTEGYERNMDHLQLHKKVFLIDKRNIYVDASGTHTTHYESGRYSFEQKKGLGNFYKLRPFLVVYRATYIMVEVAMLSVWHIFLRDIQKRAEKLRRSLIRLGPFYVKLGQALSTRPDILPNAYCQELAKLQDQIPPFRSSIALKFIESELGYPPSKLFADISAEPVAAASLGQVYKAHLVSGEPVAVKVQRPGMRGRLMLDSHLLHIVGGSLRRFLGARGDIVGAVNEMVEHMFDEIDYRKEGLNAERFAMLYGEQIEGSGQNIYVGGRRKSVTTFGLVKVPRIYWNLSSHGVLTMEWIDGIKMTDLETLQKMNFDIQQLVDQGVFCSLRQLLEEGFFHADPHPGNLVVTKDGKLAYFDFGMMGDFPREYRIGLIRTGIMNQLSDVMYKFNFSLPPQYALVIRALGSLEGTATLLDPQFKVVASAYPFIIGRLLTDPDPQMRKILRELLIRNNGSIRWSRLERLVIAIAQQSTDSSKQSVKEVRLSSQDGLGGSPARSWGFFDTRTVVSAASNFFEYILSEDGYRVRILLVKDIVRTFCIYMDASSSDHDSASNKASNSGVKDDIDQDNVDFSSRVSMGINAFLNAICAAPELWASLIIKFATRPDAQKLTGEIIHSLIQAYYNKRCNLFWISLSEKLHDVYD